MKKNKNNVEIMPVLLGLAAGVGTDIAMDVLDKKVEMFTNNPTYAPALMELVGLGGMWFGPKKAMLPFFAVATIATAELARPYTHLVKGLVEDALNGITSRSDGAKELS